MYVSDYYSTELLILSCHFQELCKELEVKSALKSSVICSGTEILQLSEREHTNTHSPSRRSAHYNSQSEYNATSDATSSIKDDPSAEAKEEDSLKYKALTSESMQSGVYDEGDANFQDESPDEWSLFKSSSSFNVTLDGNAYTKMSKDATMSSCTDVLQVMELSPVLLSLKDHLTEVEHSWVELHSDITEVQQLLHQVKKIFLKRHCFTQILTIKAFLARCLLLKARLWFHLLIPTLNTP